MNTPSTMSPPPLYSVLLISAAALAYEVLLMRLFSIVQWHHFAYMVISLALLGYAASGTFVTLTRKWLIQHFTMVFAANAVLFGLSSVLCFLLAQQIPFNTLEMFWDPGQWKFLLISYLLLFIPFFFAANCICIAFTRYGDQIPRIYSYDLIGAGIGALGVVLALYALSPQETLLLVAMLGLFAGLIVLLKKISSPRWKSVWLLGCAVLITGSWQAAGWIELRSSEYKALSQMLQVMGVRVLAEHSSPLGMITVVESPLVPFRHAPGLSLSHTSGFPRQLAVYTDGDAPSVITRYDGRKETVTYLDHLTSAAPYHLIEPANVLVLGMGGGSGLLQAALHDVAELHAVELNPQMTQLFQQDYVDFSGWSFLQARTQIHTAEARGFLAGWSERFDLIQISLLDSASAGSAGVYGLSESYLYTREGLAAYLEHLNPGGLLAVTRWVKLPPRDGLKLFATAIEALHDAGVEDPARHLLLLRGWSTSTLLIGKEPFSSQDIAGLRTFCEERMFDIAYYPGISTAEVNRYNVLPQPYFYQSARELLGEGREAFLDRYKFDISPATDDRPYFFDFFKWSTLPEIVNLYRQGGFSLLELGYPVLILTLIQGVAASAVLILFPLLFVRGQVSSSGKYDTWRVFAFFGAIGLAFLFVEIAFIQKFILFLVHPLYAVAVVLSGFLIFSGLGSAYATRFLEQKKGRRIYGTTAVLGLIAIGYLALLPLLFSWMAGAPGVIKILVALVLIAPLAFCMGIPFPLGLAQLSAFRPDLVPWAWAVNGGASLISAILATLLAIHLGFRWVVLIAVLLYLIAALVFPGKLSTNTPGNQKTKA